MPSAVDERTAFLAERATGIGGSDVASLFNIGYGCQLRLWREKRGETPDFPRLETGAMKLGNILEPFFAAEYSRITERQVVSRGVARHPLHNELLVHVDRIIFGGERIDPGVLEIKAVSRAMFYKVKREGLPEDYVLQLQHGMLVTGLKWGAFAVGSRDSGDLMHWDVPRNESFCQLILDAGPAFWARVENGPMPERLDIDDPRCQRCEYRTSCQGAALMEIVKDIDYVQDESLRSLVLDLVERKALKKEAEELVDESAEELKFRLGDRTMVAAAGVKIQYYPFIKKAYTVKEHAERPLRVYPEKGK